MDMSFETIAALISFAALIIVWGFAPSKREAPSAVHVMRKQAVPAS
ncbi:MAG: hypothetical protein QOF51_503 [Chloroflexota bacterium]|jgi:hypothetical protein|nr:hypothetical protein [Chloroflexota bacterium]